MEWIADPNIWVGLLTLIVLEIVLGIDNLIFIAIIAEKVPPHQRDKARLVGLALAMLMRLGLLSVISWIVTLTTPLFSVGPMAFSGRDLILLLGGIFLLFKATVELHERVEGQTHVQSGPVTYASFLAVVAQIIVLDAVFSLDSVITAVGMVDELGVMIAAVIISMAVMITASKPLTRFVNAHPTVVVLCLSFLLMIGLSLIAEGFGFHIPKGYLYAAIGFSVGIEALNQLARRNLVRQHELVPFRERTAAAVLRLLGDKQAARRDEPSPETVDAEDDPVFETAERHMVSGVLSLSQRPVRSIMTNRSDISWVDLDADIATIRAQVLDTPHSFFPASRGQLDNIVGVARGKDLVADLARGETDLMRNVRPPIVMPDTAGVLQVMETLKRSHGALVLIADEYGTIQGVVTPIDILEAIAGEFPDEDEQPDVLVLGPNRWQVDGSADLHHLAQILGSDALGGATDDYTSLAGFMLERFGALPKVGEVLVIDGLRLEVTEVIERRIASVLISRAMDQAAGSSLDS
ncbi:putative tellurium resistance membrane protein TerC [Pseudoduganella lurida]|uniref:Putative tellurium resistance membrane protein TerC n=1 Tax=Pseudoduganella lurida TaxID=1036180 RepID=A0A562RL52_9BURK|nr:TerC family protein [Pseudoduganella lurida]TWI69150.1 putative tellurium resistance membrane protein TerC [Pseudoduganella lurida]